MMTLFQIRSLVSNFHLLRTTVELKTCWSQFTLENHLEKKSHTSKMWQKRYFKIITRENSDIIANNMQAISDLEDD